MTNSVSSVNPKHKLAAFFSGVGGIELGFELTNKFRVVYANEFDRNAAITYSLNFPNVFLDQRDIRVVEPKDVATGELDIIVGGFPCQAFSIAGYRKGFEDERGDLFFELLRIIKAKTPKAIFIENVKNMVTHDHGNTFKVIREALTENGYYIKWKVMNGKDYGNVPQNRERIYIVGFLSKSAYDAFEFPEEIELTASLTDVIDFKKEQPDNFYYTEGVQSFYEELKEHITRRDRVYQWRRQYVRENKSGVVPTLTANMGMGGHNVPLILTEDGRIRKLTPKETFNVQGYPEDYQIPQNVSLGQLYKQAGNSVVVPLVERIASQIDRALAVYQEEKKMVQGTFAVIYTQLMGRYEGQAYVKEYVESFEEALRIVEDYQDGVEVLSDEEYLNIIKKKISKEFYSIQRVD